MTPQETQLIQTAQKIRQFQVDNSFSDAALCRQYAGLGSTKTYARILAGDLSELNVERQLENYTQVLELTEIRRDPEDERIYDDLKHVRQCRTAVKESYKELGNDRLIILEGATGCGKTRTLDILETEFQTVAARAEAHSGWKQGNNPIRFMLVDLLVACRMREYAEGRSAKLKPEAKVTVADSIPSTYMELHHKLIDALNVRKRIVLIDEAHEMGPYTMNTLRTLINQTPSVFVIAVIPTIWRRLESRSYDDAVQLTGNRLYEKVVIPSPQPGEVALFLERRNIQFEKADKDACIAKLCELAPQYANWKFISRFARRARAAKGAVDAEQFIEHVRAIEKARKGTL